MSVKEILIAEDDKPSADLLKQVLLKGGYSVDIAINGKDAFEAIQKKKYDALLTDWMMPEMDGIELIRRVRETINPVPVIVVLTALSLDNAREHALNSGADDFVGKPYDPEELIKKVKDLFSKKKQTLPPKIKLPVVAKGKAASFSGICIAASSGGPKTLRKFFELMPKINEAAIFIVQHGPPWALKDMARNWNKTSAMDIVLADHRMDICPGKVYLAPGGMHMTVTIGSMKISLIDDPPENHVKPAADPLFRSVAKSFGNRSIGIILTGMGCDGALGAGYISAAKGIVIAEDPNSAIVFSMPEMAIKAVPGTIVLSLDDIPAKIVELIKKHPSKK